MKLFTRLAWLLVVFSLVIAGPAFAKSKTEKKRDKILAMREEVLEKLYETDPGAQKRIESSLAYGVFSNVGVNLFFVSAGGGNGVVEDKKGKRTYMKMGQAGVGLGLGVKDFRGIFIFNNQAKLDAFLEKGWDFGAEADAAAKSGEKGGAAARAANLSEGVEVIQMTETGLALQATLNGTKYWKDDDLNDE